ncbi:NAD(P)-binding protein [Xylaria intraflava]|nr:NAD(P)-binding protein [Xylaria intraflava]
MESASRPFDTFPEQRATALATLRRQLCVVPPPVKDVDLSGKTAIVTGSNGGIGLECARQLLGLGLARLILAVRNEQKGQQARTALLSECKLPENAIDVWPLDMLSYDSITTFVEKARTLDRLDIAVLNAGIFNQKFKMAHAHTASSHEETIQLNVLSTTLLSILLLPVFKTKSPSLANSPGRLVVVSSDVASFAKFKERGQKPLLPSLNELKLFDAWERYCTSKLLSQLAISELAKRVDPSIAVITLPNPGLCYGTSLGQLPGTNVVDMIGSVIKRIFGRHPSVGTRTITAGAVKFKHEAHGQYVEDGKLEPLAPFAYEPEGERVAQLLWDELMQELSFANPEGILEGLKSSSAE